MPSPIVISSEARISYLALWALRRTLFTSARNTSSSGSDFIGGPFTATYEPGLPPSGPLGEPSVFGVRRITPRALKHHLDQFVVGQERAKKVLSVSVYNHYQRIQELQRRDEEEAARDQQRARREMAEGHDVEGDHDGQSPTSPFNPAPDREHLLGSSPLIDHTPLAIEKSNILLLGPSGVGKTLMAKTLARVLEVPFSMSDCTPFTQAGYIGEDAEVCVQRLLAASNYDVALAERGIICLDEIDKIATAKVNHGKDVSGEGVQQALLKIIEGTSLQISAKPDRGSGNGKTPGGSSGTPLGGSGGSFGAGKSDSYTVRTDNILFIFTGAFVGLPKIILDRISRGSIGFNQPVHASNFHENPFIKGEDALFKKHLPFFTPNEGEDGEVLWNPLDFLEPGDLQKYGMIPELVGRIPVTTALSALDEEALVRVLTETRNCLLRQYEQLFQLSGVELRITSSALRVVAKTALGMQTGARGLRSALERLLSEAMFEAPGSSIKHILITEAVAQRKSPPLYFARGQQHLFHSKIAAEEERWLHGQVTKIPYTAKKTSDHSEPYPKKSRAVGGG
ncbi:MAG: hypothetical protein M1829_001221 [Trizodia sp. TS-e1964]|nr:MAG: hypothetical protein M1829_001221 [Trizodia sp. TS-e1964]